jgi:hypothetical protein
MYIRIALTFRRKPRHRRFLPLIAYLQSVRSCTAHTTESQQRGIRGEPVMGRYRQRYYMPFAPRVRCIHSAAGFLGNKSPPALQPIVTFGDF